MTPGSVRLLSQIVAESTSSGGETARPAEATVTLKSTADNSIAVQRNKHNSFLIFLSSESGEKAAKMMQPDAFLSVRLHISSDLILVVDGVAALGART